jgi:hypothetical protein
MGVTMEVVEYEPDNSYEARCTGYGCCSLGKISPELLIVKGDSIATSEPAAVPSDPPHVDYPAPPPGLSPAEKIRWWLDQNRRSAL